MNIITTTTSTNDFDNGGCSYVLIDLTPIRAKTILDRMDLARRLHESDVSLHELHYWCCEAVLFSAIDDLPADIDLPDDSQSYVVVSPVPAIPESCCRRTDYEHMAISVNGAEPEVYWRASPANSSIYVETAQLPRSLIERATT